MKNLRGTLMAAVALATMIGFSGTAMADPNVEQLINPGAEDGVLDPWTSSDVDAGDVVNDPDGANEGGSFFATGLASITEGPSVTISQDVDITGCGVEGLDGSWEANGFVATDNDTDTGQLVVMLDDGSAAMSGAVNNQGSYVAIAMDPISGAISDEAVTATVSMIGTDVNEDGIASVRFDDMSFLITCVMDFAKISGKIIGEGGKGRDGRAGQWSFTGTVGHFDDEAMTLAGEYSINYKVLGQSCVFTPTSLDFSDSSATVMADYVCDDDVMTSGTATIRLTQGAGGSNKNKNKDRGSVCVDADDDVLDIGANPDVCVVASDEIDLNKGNVKVSPPEMLP